jgi:hypothetical protein
MGVFCDRLKFVLQQPSTAILAKTDIAKWALSTTCLIDQCQKCKVQKEMQLITFERLKSPPKININNNAKNEIYAIQEE